MEQLRYPLPPMLLSFTVPSSNDRDPQYIHQALSNIHQSLGRRCITLGIGRIEDSVRLYLRCDHSLAETAERRLYAQYPNASIERITENTFPPGARTWTKSLRLTPDLFPLNRYRQFDDDTNRTLADPLADLFETLNTHDMSARIEWTIRPAAPVWRRRARRCLRRLDTPYMRENLNLADHYATMALSPSPFSRSLVRVFDFWLHRRDRARRMDLLTTSTNDDHEREEDLQAASAKFESGACFVVEARLIASASQDRRKAANNMLRDIAASFGALAGRRASLQLISRPRPFLLSSEELATVWHPPTKSAQGATASTVTAQLPIPKTLPIPDSTGEPICILGDAIYRTKRQRFGIPLSERRLHQAIFGKSGMGKSTLLEQQAASDIAGDRGVCVIDPHGDLVENLLHRIPTHRTNDVIVFDPADTSYPIAFNPLHCRSASQQALVVSDILSTFKKLHGTSWGPRLEYILTNALWALVELPDTSLVSLQRFLGDRLYRERIALKLRNPGVRNYWLNEFAGKPRDYQEEAIASVQNKVGRFVLSPVLRNIVGQAKSRFDLRSIMDEGKILLVNLSKGRLGEDISMLLGSFLVAQIQLNALGRADLPLESRRDFFLYVDEFQNYVTESFATILSEARKYGLSLTVANQYLGQLRNDTQTLDALLGNVQSFICFQVGVNDADVLAPQLSRSGDVGQVAQFRQHLTTLPRYNAYVSISLQGLPQSPFLMQTLPPSRISESMQDAAIIRRLSRDRYARPVADVEAEIQAADGYYYR